MDQKLLNRVYEAGKARIEGFKKHELMWKVETLIRSGKMNWAAIQCLFFSNPKSRFGTEGEMLKYGHIMGPEVYVPVRMGASEVISAASGRFVKSDGSGRAEIAGDGSTQLIGHVEGAAQTCSSTEGATVLLLNISLSAVYRIPIGTGTLAYTEFYDTCDLIVASNIQGAQVGVSSEDTVIIVGGDITNQQWVDVMLNPAKMGAQGVV
jgi:hypothetical protein